MERRKEVLKRLRPFLKEAISYVKKNRYCVALYATNGTAEYFSRKRDAIRRYNELKRELPSLSDKEGWENGEGGLILELIVINEASLDTLSELEFHVKTGDNQMARETLNDISHTWGDRIKSAYTYLGEFDPKLQECPTLLEETDMMLYPTQFGDNTDEMVEIFNNNRKNKS